ncbi:hypothetical protein [Chitinilyticum piscinae]|uniref:hypothetical protein n=1 Tax=Chitinilyticum piscinae TaxID=2866724 RepID=UPI00187E0C72|nr:hypothetical protein [Chitinilyticum piscinae]
MTPSIRNYLLPALMLFLCVAVFFGYTMDGYCSPPNIMLQLATSMFYISLLIAFHKPRLYSSRRPPALIVIIFIIFISLHALVLIDQYNGHKWLSEFAVFFNLC